MNDPMMAPMASNKSGNWIANAVKGGKGQFKAKAKAAGFSTKQFALKKAKGRGKTAKQANLALTLMKFRKAGK